MSDTIGFCKNAQPLYHEGQDAIGKLSSSINQLVVERNAFAVENERLKEELAEARIEMKQLDDMCDALREDRDRYRILLDKR